MNTNTTPESFSQDLLRKARQRFLGSRNPHPTCHLIKVIDVEVSIDGAPVHLYRGISIDQVRLKEYRYRVRTSHCRHNPLSKDKHTPARSRHRGTFAGRDKYAAYIYLSPRDIYTYKAKCIQD